MPLKSKPTTKAQMASAAKKRDLAVEQLESIRHMKSGQTRVVTFAVAKARRQTSLSQSQFAT